MKFTRTLFEAVLVTVFLCLVFTASGCASLKTAGEQMADVINENPFAVNVGTRYAVEHYIKLKPTLAGRIARAKDVQARIEFCLAFVDENPTASIDQILDKVNEVIDWQKLSENERVIVQEIVHQVELELKAKRDSGALDDDTKVAIRSLLKVAASAAKVYLLGV